MKSSQISWFLVPAWCQVMVFIRELSLHLSVLAESELSGTGAIRTKLQITLLSHVNFLHIINPTFSSSDCTMCRGVDSISSASSIPPQSSPSSPASQIRNTSPIFNTGYVPAQCNSNFQQPDTCKQDLEFNYLVNGKSSVTSQHRSQSPTQKNIPLNSLHASAASKGLN